MTLFVGIDPGFSGAFGIIDHNSEYIACGDMHHDKDVLHTDLIWDDIKAHVRGQDYEIIIESVHTMPGQGVASSGKFMKSFGQLIAMAQLSHAPWQFVTPQMWKRDLGLSSDKEESLKLARKMWPSAPLERKKDNGRAEALLIAGWYIERML